MIILFIEMLAISASVFVLAVNFFTHISCQERVVGRWRMVIGQPPFERLRVAWMWLVLAVLLNVCIPFGIGFSMGTFFGDALNPLLGVVASVCGGWLSLEWMNTLNKANRAGLHASVVCFPLFWLPGLGLAAASGMWKL